MTRDELLDISTAKIKSTLGVYIRADVPVYIFGSRSRLDNRWNSDFDLWIDADLPRSVITAVIEQLEESIVPFKVDLITTDQLSGAFGTEIKREAKRWI
jgi:predicted nucleotidyltransferase